MSELKNFRDESKKPWVQSTPGPLTIEEIKFGAILRIADATEAMAKNHLELIAMCEGLTKSRDFHASESARIARRLFAAQGQITKLKKKLGEVR